MDCKDFQIYGSAYIDDMLSEEEKSDFKNHIKKCVDCNTAFENLRTVVENVNALEEVELPANFSGELNKKLQNAKNYKLKSTLFNKGKILSGIAATLLIFVLSLSLVNNSLNRKKESGPYFVTDDAIREENININAASDEGKGKISDVTDDEERINALRMAPADENGAIQDEENKDVSQKEMQEDTMENSNDKNYRHTGFSEKPNDNEKSIINESIQSLLNDKNLNKVFGSIFVFVLITGIIILVYKIVRR